jgi:nucleoside-diphosphate-sugar epimerase
LATPRTEHVVVTGGAGYIGSVLVPELLAEGRRVTVLDRLFFGRGPLGPVLGHPGLTLVEGDVRDEETVRAVFTGRAQGGGRGSGGRGGPEDAPPDAVIHLAAISNDPSAKLAPDLTRSINCEATRRLLALAKEGGVNRLLYASSASVYGIKDTPDVTEDLPLDPITLYARCKAEGELVLEELADESFTGVSVRAATVCGDAPRLRLDLTINLLTDQALRLGWIRVFGGTQMRPNVHIRDLTAFYRLLLDADPSAVNGRAFNVCRRNSSVAGLAEMIRDEIDPSLEIRTEPTDDLRSYHLSGERARKELGFEPGRELVLAVRELRERYRRGLDPQAGDPWYRNVRWMDEHRELWG